MTQLFWNQGVYSCQSLVGLYPIRHTLRRDLQYKEILMHLITFLISAVFYRASSYQRSRLSYLRSFSSYDQVASYDFHRAFHKAFAWTNWFADSSRHNYWHSSLVEWIPFPFSLVFLSEQVYLLTCHLCSLWPLFRQMCDLRDILPAW